MIITAALQSTFNIQRLFSVTTNKTPKNVDTASFTAHIGYYKNKFFLKERRTILFLGGRGGGEIINLYIDVKLKQRYAWAVLLFFCFIYTRLIFAS